MLDPLGLHRMRGKQKEEPVTSLQCLSNFIMPLLGTADVFLAKEYRDTGSRDGVCKARGEREIFRRMREKNLSWLSPGFSFDHDRVEGPGDQLFADSFSLHHRILESFEAHARSTVSFLWDEPVPESTGH